MLRSFTFFFSILVFSLGAQQSPQSSLYNFNTYDFNPAVAGVEGKLSVNGTLRSQWVGLEGAPLIQSLNAHLPVYITRGGLGIALKNTTIGVSRNTQAALGYNQIINLNENTLVSFGLSGGIVQHSFNGGDLRTTDGIDEPGSPIIHNDPVLSEFNESSIAPLLSAGLYVKYKDLSVGISGDNLLASTFEFDDNQSEVVFNQIRHYYGYVKYELDLGNDLILQPSILLKADNAQIQADFSIAAEFGEKFILGVSYRGYDELSSDAVVLQGGFKLNNNLQLIYAYDFGLSELSSAHSGSHEILIRYEIDTKIGKGVPPPIIYNPRFL